MTTSFSPLSDTKPDDFRRAIEVTFLGQVWGTMAALSACGRGIGETSSTSARPWRLSVFRCSRLTVRPNSRAGASSSRPGPNYSMKAAISVCPWSTCRLSTPPSSTVSDHYGSAPQPVPPIYQPEIPAKLIVQAALDGRRSKVVGSWNKLLVAAGQIAPGVGNHYAALGAWESQLADLPIEPDRPDNLHHPADQTKDAGSHGIFDRKAKGFFDPSFLKTLPEAGRTFFAAVMGDARDRRRYPRSPR